MNDEVKTPRCGKCGGLQVGERDALSDRVVSIRCVICGNRLYRNFQMRRANKAEMTVNTGLAQGKPNHKEVCHV